MVKDNIRMTTSDDQSLYALSIDIWRLEQKIIKTKSSINNDSFLSILNSLDKLKKFLLDKGIEIIDLTGKKYDDSLNIDVLSVLHGKTKFATISETIEPMIKHNDHIVKRAKVIITK